MDRLPIILISILLSSVSSDAAECEHGWVAYKSELCIKAFTDLLTFDESNEFCSSQSNGNAGATMVMVKELDIQDLLASYTHDIVNSLWLGGKYNEEIGDYIWNDGELVTYTNWQDGYPRNSTDSPCMELRPINAKVENGTEGKWSDVSCQKRNLALCQRSLTWTLQDAINEIIKLQKAVLPIGSTYVEYFGQPSPRDLWPTLTWEDISETYAGLFLRISGGESAGWGEIQSECCPRISKMSYTHRRATEGGSYPSSINMPSSGWSEQGNAGEIYSSTGPIHFFESLRFNVESCEVRPRNQAIKIWKRIA